MTLQQLHACCGSDKWARKMFSQLPFTDSTSMHRAADDIWWFLQPEDWLEAFSQHPKIGQQVSTKWSLQEQSGMTQASIGTAEQMARLNAEYEAKFGFIFIVCATGRSADEMLLLLRERIQNSREREIRNAAGEQAKITHLRLDKL